MKPVKEEVQKISLEQRLENLQAQSKEVESTYFRIQGAIELIKGLIADKNK